MNDIIKAPMQEIEATQLTGRPQEILLQAQEAAKALTTVIAGKKNPVMFNKEQYLEFEDWQTVARFYGYTVQAISTNFVEYGEVKGFEAKANVLDRLGQVVSSAEGMCLNDEANWGARPKYEWHYVCKNGNIQLADPGKEQIIWEKTSSGKSLPKKQKILIGTEQVPLFQLRSMAQTRACSKALRNVLAWVVVLAGYKPTPAEEMESLIQKSEPKQIQRADEVVITDDTLGTHDANPKPEDVSDDDLGGMTIPSKKYPGMTLMQIANQQTEAGGMVGINYLKSYAEKTVDPKTKDLLGRFLNQLEKV